MNSHEKKERIGEKRVKKIQFPIEETLAYGGGRYHWFFFVSVVVVKTHTLASLACVCVESRKNRTQENCEQKARIVWVVIWKADVCSFVQKFGTQIIHYSDVHILYFLHHTYHQPAYTHREWRPHACNEVAKTGWDTDVVQSVWIYNVCVWKMVKMRCLCCLKVNPCKHAQPQNFN